MKLFKKSKAKKRKSNGLKTLEDCKKYYLKNSEYRYLIVAGREKSRIQYTQPLKERVMRLNQISSSTRHFPWKLLICFMNFEREN